MERKKELEKLKKIIKEYYNDGDCGFYNTRNIIGDPMVTIFDGKFFTVDICFNYGYFEVFGTTDIEFNELIEFYNKLK